MQFKRILCLLMIVSMICTLTGCEIFEKKKVAVTEAQAITFNDLTEGYYIKTGDSYYATYSDGFTFATSTPVSVNKERVFWMKGKEKLIPVLYKNSYLIYKSEDNVVRNFTFEKYQDAGYTIGIKSIDIGVDFYSCNLTSSNVYEGSSAESVLSKEINDGKTIMFESINEEAITERNISECRTLVGLDANKKYLLGCYIGTEYREYTVIADIHAYYSESIEKASEFSYTHNGYTIITIPDTLESGFYSVNGSGLFYYAKDKSSSTKFFPKTSTDIPSIKVYEDETGEAQTQAPTEKPSEAPTEAETQKPTETQTKPIEQATVQ